MKSGGMVGKGTVNHFGRVAPHSILRAARSIHMDLVYLTIAVGFFLLSGWLISALDRLQ